MSLHNFITFTFFTDSHLWNVSCSHNVKLSSYPPKSNAKVCTVKHASALRKNRRKKSSARTLQRSLSWVHAQNKLHCTVGCSFFNKFHFIYWKDVAFNFSWCKHSLKFINNKYNSINFSRKAIAQQLTV